MRINGSIEIPDEAIDEFCRKWKISELALYGSVLREDFGPGSDIDVLVEFEPGCTPGFAFFEIQAELSELFRRNVDLNTPHFLSPRVRRNAEAEAKVLFAAE
jgi:predicted nucleotidyltransferase